MLALLTSCWKRLLRGADMYAVPAPEIPHPRYCARFQRGAGGRRGNRAARLRNDTFCGGCPEGCQQSQILLFCRRAEPDGNPLYVDIRKIRVVVSARFSED